MNTVSFDYSKKNSGVEIEKYRGTESIVDVPHKIAGLRVTKICDGAFANCKELTKITLPFTVTEIHPGAFAGCKRLQEIVWDHTTIKFGGNVIKLDRNEIQLPAILLDICNPKEISAPTVTSKLLKTPVEDFDYSRSESGIVIEKYFGAAENVVIPSKIDGVPVVRIGFKAFDRCRNLLELRLPAGLTSINSRAFDGCDNLKTVYLPRTLLDGKIFGEISAALPKDCKIQYV